MDKISILFYGLKENYDTLCSFADKGMYDIYHIRDINECEAFIIKKSPSIVIISLHKGQNADIIPYEVLEKQRHMSYYFLIAYLSEDTTYLQGPLLKNGFDETITAPINETSIKKLEKLLSIPKREIRAILIQGWIMNDIDNNFFFAKSKDFSRSGMLFESARKIEIGKEVRISFVMPVIKDNITLFGKIVRCVSPINKGELFRYGLNFEKIPRYSQRVLDRFFEEELKNAVRTD